jgi:hypothetical protein
MTAKTLAFDECGKWLGMEFIWGGLINPTVITVLGNQRMI